MKGLWGSCSKIVVNVLRLRPLGKFWLACFRDGDDVLCSLHHAEHWEERPGLVFASGCGGLLCSDPRTFPYLRPIAASLGHRNVCPLAKGAKQLKFFFKG